ncbi:MAG: hypothetical protein DGJ47_000014 [Rickettsiaceae bacterium]
MNKETYDVIIIGAGAAGLMSAAIAGSLGKKALLIEHTNKVGEKIRISGGGRCNFTNLKVGSEHFICPNPHFVKSALAQYSQNDFIKMVADNNIAYHEKTLGQLFCDGSSKQIIEMLVNQCKQYGVDIKKSCAATDIQKSSLFAVQTNLGDFESKSLIIATGGLSIPKIGASRFGYDVATQFNLKVNNTHPALVPVTIDKTYLDKYKDLRGTANHSIATCNKTSFKENILFTHKGFSGPAILQISSYLPDLTNSTININLLPNDDLYNYFRRNNNSKTTPASYLKNHLTNRLVKYLTTQNPDLEQTITSLSKQKLQYIAKTIHEFEIRINGSEGYAKAEVTSGGVDTDQINSKTMECKKVPGLYFVGEVLDVTGWLGGYNFQWAWSSGYVAGLNC